MSKDQASPNDAMNEILAELDELQGEIEKTQASPDTSTSSTDEELAKIEKDLLDATDNVVDLSDFRDKGSQASMEESLPPVSEVKEFKFDDLQNQEESPVKTPDVEEGALTLKLSGKMTLKLQYECDGQEVTVGFDHDTFEVKLADGTEFRVPVRKVARSKAA